MKKFKNIIFDFDGVVLDSVAIKNKVFSKTVSGYNKIIQKKFINFHLNNLGLSRYYKYEFLCRKLLKLKTTQYLKKKLVDDYSKILNKEIKNTKYIKGIKKFIIKNKEKNLFISSGTPQKELRKICSERKISKYFLKILGSPKTKYQHLKYLKNKYKFSKNNTVFFGDAVADFNAAKKYDLTFIQVGKNMKNSKIKLKIKDFRDKKIQKYFNKRS
tara:strand:- start:36 stop:680 length:645 start_codon:yes stop_codon:yes gene_type:complete